jgi:hypothetical protein
MTWWQATCCYQRTKPFWAIASFPAINIEIIDRRQSSERNWQIFLVPEWCLQQLQLGKTIDGRLRCCCQRTSFSWAIANYPAINIEILDCRQCSRRSRHSNCPCRRVYQLSFLSSFLSKGRQSLMQTYLWWWVQMDWQIKVRNCHKLMRRGNLYAWCLTRSPHGLRNWQQSLLWWPRYGWKSMVKALGLDGCQLKEDDYNSILVSRWCQ